MPAHSPHRVAILGLQHCKSSWRALLPAFAVIALPGVISPVIRLGLFWSGGAPFYLLFLLEVLTVALLAAGVVLVDRTVRGKGRGVATKDAQSIAAAALVMGAALGGFSLLYLKGFHFVVANYGLHHQNWRLVSAGSLALFAIGLWFVAWAYSQVFYLVPVVLERGAGLRDSLRMSRELLSKHRRWVYAILGGGWVWSMLWETARVVMPMKIGVDPFGDKAVWMGFSIAGSLLSATGTTFCLVLMCVSYPFVSGRGGGDE